MTETILKLLEDKDSDNDEVNARIWCYENSKEFISVYYYYAQRPSAKFKSPDSTGGWDYKPTGADRYITSLDKAMSIGAEDLGSVTLDMFQDHDGVTASCYWVHWQGYEHAHDGSSEHLPSLPRAICHARIQALEYVRGL